MMKFMLEIIRLKKMMNSNLTSSIIMNPNPKFIDKEALVYDAFIIMKDLNITQLIVLEENKYCGIIHLHDIIKEGIAE